MRPIKASKKEWGTTLITCFLALGAFVLTDQYVVLTMLAFAFAACLYLAYHHEGRRWRRSLFVVAAALTLGFVGYRGYLSNRSATLTVSAIRESARDGASRAIFESGRPEFIFSTSYNPATKEIVLTTTNEGTRIARSVSENRWIEIGRLSYLINPDFPKPDLKFNAFYSTKQGFAVIPEFIPNSGFSGGWRDWGDLSAKASILDRWIDQTPDLLRAAKADRSSVLRYRIALTYADSLNVTNRQAANFCFDVRLFTVGPRAHSDDIVLLSCE